MFKDEQVKINETENFKVIKMLQEFDMLRKVGLEEDDIENRKDLKVGLKDLEEQSRERRAGFRNKRRSTIYYNI